MIEPDNRLPTKQQQFSGRVAAQVARKLGARAARNRVVPFGLGMMGLIGWSVTVPTVLGVALGIWLDRHHPIGHSWTLALLIVGLVLGCWTAWQWVAREMAALQRSDPDEFQ